MVEEVWRGQAAPLYSTTRCGDKPWWASVPHKHEYGEFDSRHRYHFWTDQVI